MNTADSSMPQAENTGWVDWRKTAARQVLLDDLEPDGYLFGKDHISAEVLWQFYRKLPQFQLVVFSQFKARLKDHRQQASVLLLLAQRDARALAHDRQLFPRQKHNKRGEPVFDVSAAKLLLKEDIKNKLHTTMFPSELQKTRPEYAAFQPHIFKQRIYQEERHQKYLHFRDLERAKLRHPKKSST
jgi:hypothetical protein